jgi:hypothetical protein
MSENQGGFSRSGCFLILLILYPNANLGTVKNLVVSFQNENDAGVLLPRSCPRVVDD